MKLNPTREKSLGIAACTAIVVGNMVGSGFYLSPSAVAPYGTLAIVVWVLMGAGAICLGLTFAKLARLRPETGGPYAYTRIAYGDFPGFLIAWVYWISIWASLPVIAVAFAGAIIDMFPGLHSRVMATVLTLAAIWAVVLINLRGVKAAGLFAELMTYSKMIPFGAIAIIGLFYVDPTHFSEFNASGKPLLTATAALAPLTMFAYLGLKSATVPAGDVKDPERTIPRSTILGITIAMLLYVLGTIAVMGIVPREQLVKSVAPFSDAAQILWGPWGATAISIAVILSSIGALNGWTLLMGQVPMAAARDGLFPAIFSRLSERGVPAVGIIVSAILSTVLVLIQAAGTSGIPVILLPRRRSEHHGGSHSVCILRHGGRPHCGTCAGRDRAARDRSSRSSPSSSRSSRSMAAVPRPFCTVSCCWFSAFPSMCGSGAARRKQRRGPKVIKSPRPLIQINA